VVVGGPVSLPNLTKVPPPPAGVGEAARPEDLSAPAEMAAGPDVAVAEDGTATVVWSARNGADFAIAVGGVRLDRRHGTATVAVVVPGLGTVSLDGSVPRSRAVATAVRVTLRVLPKPPQLRALRRKGSVRLNLAVTFQPSGGLPRSRFLQLAAEEGAPRVDPCSPARKGVR